MQNGAIRTALDQQLQGLIQAAEDLNRNEQMIVAQVADILRGWAMAKQRNAEELRQRIAALGMPASVPAGQAPGDYQRAIKNMRDAGYNGIN